MPRLTAAPQPPHALGSQNDAPDNSLCDPPPRSAALRAASRRLWRHRCTCGAPREAGAGRMGVHTDFEKGRKMTHSKNDSAKRHPDLRCGAAHRGDDRWCMAIRLSAGKLAVQQPGCPGNSLRLATTSSSRRHGAIDPGPNRRDATYARARAEMRALGIFPVLRDAHLAEPEPRVRAQNEQLVDLFYLSEGAAPHPGEHELPPIEDITEKMKQEKLMHASAEVEEDVD